MARSLPFALDQRMLRPKRRPGYQILLYDLRSTADTIGSIVRGLTLDPLTGPLDVTANVLSVDIEEVAGDFVSSGIPASSIGLTIIDPTPGNVESVWDPALSAGDPTLPARFLRRGNAIRILEGDVDVAFSDWPITFTGTLVGQAGVDRGRAVDERGRSLITIRGVDRSAAYVNQLRTSEEFARPAAYLTMGTDVATNVMGLDADEIVFGGWGTQTTGLPIQFVEQSPLVSLAQLMFLDGFLPRFAGDGKLTQSSGETTQPPARIYTNLDLVRHIAKPFSELDPVNSVEVIGLDATKTEVVQQRQELATISVTTGYFTPKEEIKVYWSEDRTVLAKNVKLKIQRSINGGLSILGGDEDHSNIFPDGGGPLTIGARLELETGFAPYIIIFLTATYVGLAWVPDEVIVTIGLGVTIPVGRASQALALANILILMTRIGRGQYSFEGEPTEYVFKEIRAIAELEGLTSETLNRVSIENHLVQNQSDADTAARVVLFRQQARGAPRQITMLHDLRLEPDDVLETPDGRRYLIEKVSRRLVRAPAEVVASISAFDVTPGLAP